MTTHYDFRPIEAVNSHQKVTFVSPFKPDEKLVLDSLREKKKEVRQNALLTFHLYYSQEIDKIDDSSIWLSGSLTSYKLVEIRNILKLSNSKVSTRETKNVDLLVVGDKTKVETLPKNIPFISAIAFEEKLNKLKEKVANEPKQEEGDQALIELLLTGKEEEAFAYFEERGISLTLLPLMFAIFKVHTDKTVRAKAKVLLLKEKNKTAKDAMSFCEKRNFLNAKYSVGMEDLEKIKGFDIALFLYYLVLHQKNHLGKEYLASLESKWTQRVIEEQELLNQKELILYGEAGEDFVYAKKIETFTVHAYSSVLWKMYWLKSLTIIELKKSVVLPSIANFSSLESLTLETKTLTLAGTLPIKELTIINCKKINIDERLKLPNIENIKLEKCAFGLDTFKEFLPKVSA